MAGYLDQHGRRIRADQPGPASLWDALAAHANGLNDLGRLAQAARNRGLYRHAASLWTKAAAAGCTDAAVKLVTHLGTLTEPSETTRAARWAVSQASLDDPWYVAALVRALHADGAADAIQVLLARDPAGQVQLMFPEDVAQLLEALRAAGAGDAVRALAARVADPAVEYYLWDATLLTALRAAGAWDVIRTLAAEVAGQMRIDHPEEVADLLGELRDTGAAEAVQALLARDPVGQVSLDDPWDVASLLEALGAAAAGDAVQALASRAAHGVSLDDPQAVVRLLAALRAAGTDDAVRTLTSRAAHGADLHDPEGVAQLLAELRRTGAGDAVQTLLARDPSHQVTMDASQPFRPGYQRPVARLLAALREVGAAEAVQVLATRAADAGMFGLFLEVWPGEAAAYRFGREPDGTVSPPWSWSEPPRA